MSALPGSEPAVFAFGPFVLDRDRRLLARDGAAVAITPKAFDLLVLLVERAGTAVTKDELMTRLWPDTVVDENNLTFQVSTLRKALGPDGARCISTLPGRGYQFVAPLQRLDGAAMVEDEVRATITVTESETSHAATWLRGAVLALLVLGAAAAVLFFRKDTPPPSPAIRSLAVLPFKPLTAAQRDEALELGMADTLITRLSRTPGVIVRPIGAVRRYSKLDDDPLAAGRDLGVDAVVDGSIQRVGSRMRVTVRLLRTRDGTPAWSSQFDDDARDLFAVQDRVAEQVARAIAPSAEPRLARTTTNDVEAYEFYVRGRYWAGLAQANRAEEFYQRAIVRDAKFAAAWAALADAWVHRARFGNSSPREYFDRAREAAMKAMALDPELAEAHVALAQIAADHDWDWERADAQFRRALELNPNSDIAHMGYAQLLLYRRDLAGAMKHSRRAVEIDPLSPGPLITRGVVLECARPPEEAIAHWEETLRVHPRLIPALLHLGMAQVLAGEPDHAVATYDRALEIHPNSQLLSLQAYAHASAGRREKALVMLRELEKDADPPAHNLALAWVALGDHDRAFAWLERAYDERLFLLRFVTVLPGYAPLRSDPRYAALLRKMRL
jgi:DNA-binding winged helix-turn-helix (wHTH) protein/TolB-like protein/Tfp pilus assembly protein PilF